jgi:hypothetical protein
MLALQVLEASFVSSESAAEYEFPCEGYRDG